MSQVHHRKTKKAQLVQMLQRKSGADIEAISAKMGWLPHTTRAALSGLRKAGYNVIKSEVSNGGAARYRITGDPESAEVLHVEHEVNANAR